MKIRQPAVANMFYPGEPRMLKQNILQYLGAAEVSEEVRAKVRAGKLKGIIVPHAGYIYSGPVAAYGYKLLGFLPKDREWKILLIGLSHSVPFSGAAVVSDGVWKTPLGDVRVKDLRDELGVAHDDEEIFLDVPEAHIDEHSLEVQVPFLQAVFGTENGYSAGTGSGTLTRLLDGKFVLYPLATGSVRPDLLAGKLADFVKGDDVIVVVSSDLSHYLPYEEAVRIDNETLSNIVAMKTDDVIERGDACGLKGILTMMFLAEKFGWKPELLDYRNSGDTAGEKDKVVGYGSVAWMK